MRSIRTIAPLALGFVALAVAGCQRPSDQTTAAPTPTQIQQNAPVTTVPARQAPLLSTAPRQRPSPTRARRPLSTCGRSGPCRLGRSRTAPTPASSPGLLSAELVSTAYAEAELDLFAPYTQRVGPAAYQVRSHLGEWEATLHLAQPIRHNDGIWVVARVGDR
jgi:hypothetical protein